MRLSEKEIKKDYINYCNSLGLEPYNDKTKKQYISDAKISDYTIYGWFSLPTQMTSENINRQIYFESLKNALKDFTTYRGIKEKIRQQAIEYQSIFSNYCLDYGTIYRNNRYFEKMGKKYGLLKEFRVNGII